MSARDLEAGITQAMAADDRDGGRDDRRGDLAGATLTAPGVTAGPPLPAATLDMARTLAAGDDDPDEAERRPPITPRLGRYVVLDPLGEGGMGIVYAAYDPELDRRVAIKLLRAGHGDPDARLRLLREAQAMAKLSHPNVVAIYDVGTFEGQVFMALELVRGQSLGDWLDKSPRTWPEVLAVFLAAGRGLAAAHAAGLVHRDFKPDNVLLADDGAVKVTDFGLARGGPPSAALAPPPGAPEGGRTLDLQLTRHGAVMGTPAYMAPEQHEGRPVDARTDVFAFCAALYQGVYGQLPFPTDSWAALVTAVGGGEVRPPPPGARAPAWLDRALRRGLRPRPDDRWPSMDALLAELARDRARARRRLALGGAALALGIAAFARGGGPSDPAAACTGAAAELAATWSADARARVDAALRGTGASFAGDAAARAVAGLDRYAAAWSDARTAACQAHQRGERTHDLYDLELACLSRRRADLAARVAVLAEADARVAEEAVLAVAALPDLAACADPARLRAAYEPPPPAARAEITAIQGRLARATAEGDAGRPARGLERIAEPLLAAEALDHPPLLAEALLARGALEELAGAYADAEATLARAWWLALAARHDDVAAAAATALIAVVGRRLGRADHGLEWSRHADAMLTRRSLDDRLGALRHANLAALHHGQARHADALADLDAALLAYRRHLPADHPTFAGLLALRGDVLRALGRRDEAIADLEAARAALEAALGPDHPRVAAALNNLGAALTEDGALDRAQAALDRAVAVHEAALGPDHPDLAAALNNLAIVLMKRADDPAAAAALDRAIAIRERASADDPALSDALLNRGSLHLQRGRRDLALADYQRALANDRAIFGEAHPNVAIARNNLGFLLWTLGRPDDAAAELEAALAGLEAALGDAHPILAAPLLGLAQVDLDRGRPAPALARLDRADPLVAGWSEGERARLRFARARARWELRRGRAADDDARAAIDAHAAIEAAGEPLADAARWSRAWLVERRLLPP